MMGVYSSDENLSHEVWMLAHKVLPQGVNNLQPPLCQPALPACPDWRQALAVLPPVCLCHILLSYSVHMNTIEFLWHFILTLLTYDLLMQCIPQSQFNVAHVSVCVCPRSSLQFCSSFSPLTTHRL